MKDRTQIELQSKVVLKQSFRLGISQPVLVPTEGLLTLTGKIKHVQLLRIVLKNSSTALICHMHECYELKTTFIHTHMEAARTKRNAYQSCLFSL